VITSHTYDPVAHINHGCLTIEINAPLMFYADCVRLRAVLALWYLQVPHIEIATNVCSQNVLGLPLSLHQCTEVTWRVATTPDWWHQVSVPGNEVAVGACGKDVAGF